MKADDENLPGVRSSQGTPGKSFDGHNKWRNVDSRASDHVDSLHPFDSLHQPGRPSEVRGYDNQAFDHGYIKEADMNVGVRSNKYGPHVQSNKRTQPTRSFDGQNEWHNTGARTADHIDTINSPDHQDQGLSGKARSFEGEHGFEKSGRMDPGNVDNVRSFNQNHPGRSMENLDSSHNSDRHQSGWDHDNQDGKQVELSSDLKRKVARSDGHRGEWNQNDRRAAKEDKLIRAVSSTSNKLENQAMDSIGDIAKKASGDQSQHYDGEMNMVSATGSGSQPNLERAADIQKYPGGDAHLQGQW